MERLKIVDLPAKRVVAFVLHTTFVDNRQARDIPPFFHSVMDERLLDAVPNRADTDVLCIIDRAKNSLDIDYYVGVEVESFEQIPDSMMPLTLRESTCIRTIFRKTANADVVDTVRRMKNHLLPSYGFAQNHDYPLLLRYDQHFVDAYRRSGYAEAPLAKMFMPIRRAAADMPRQFPSPALTTAGA